MSLLAYCLVYPLLWGISKLPFRALYLLSDGLYWLLYKGIGYRKKTVTENLALAFPDKSPEERKGIERTFYKHLCDVFLEMAKSMSISKKEMDERFNIPDLGPLKEFDAQGKPVFLVGAHMASWEWSMAINSKFKNLKGYAVYKPLANPYFDLLAKRIRGKWGSQLISTSEIRQLIGKHIKEQRPSIFGMLSDQSPMAIKADYWRTFMGIQVPVHTGAEKLARHWNIPIVYLEVEKTGRGRYVAHFETLVSDSKNTNRFEITDCYIDRVEKSIRIQPEYYLWTHKRFKHRHKDPAKYKAFVRTNPKEDGKEKTL